MGSGKAGREIGPSTIVALDWASAALARVVGPSLACSIAQFVTLRFCCGIWWRRSALALNGIVDSASGRGRPPIPTRHRSQRPIHATPPPSECRVASRRNDATTGPEFPPRVKQSRKICDRTVFFDPRSYFFDPRSHSVSIAQTHSGSGAVIGAAVPVCEPITKPGARPRA
jgi:hypothetical protein